VWLCYGYTLFDSDVWMLYTCHAQCFVDGTGNKHTKRIDDNVVESDLFED